MNKTKTGYYVYFQIPGAGKGWSLAVCAVSRKDADAYIRVHHKGGKFSYKVLHGGTVKADCGAITESAQEETRKELAKYEEHTS